MKRLILLIFSFLFSIQNTFALSSLKTNTIYQIAQPTSCITANFSSTGNSSWKTISLKLINNCSQAVDFQNAAITFTNASALNTPFWGDFSPLSYPDNTLQITSQTQAGGSFLATLNLHFPTSTGSNSILPKGSSITIIYGAPTADYVANSVKVYLQTSPATGAITLTNTSLKPANVSQPYALVNITLNGQPISSAQVPWSGRQTISGIAAGTYVISPLSVTDSNGVVYQGSASPSTVTVTANSTVLSSISYAAQANTGAINIKLQALPSQLSGYTATPTVTLTRADNHSSTTAAVKWNATTTVNQLVSGVSYTFSTPAISYNGYNCIPSFTPTSATAAASAPTVQLAYSCTVVTQTPVTLKINGLPASVTSITVTLTPTDGSNPVKKTIPLVNGSGSTVLNLPLGAIYTVSTNSISGYSVNFNPQPLTTSVNSSETITFSAGKIAVPGWPAYLAMGAVTDDSPATKLSLESRPIDTIFKYAGLGGNGDPGQIIYPIFDLQTVEQAQALTTYYQQHNIANRVIPTMVIYTAQMSGGATFTDFEYDNLVMHYINLIMESQKLQSYKTPQMPYPASIILNPDLLGMMQQGNLMSQANAAISQVPLAKALATAICFATSTIDTTYGSGLNYEQLFAAIRSKTTDNWSAMSIWDTYKIQYFNNCTANPTVPSSITIPSFTNDFPGWAESTNWLIRQFAPNVTFGWQVNLWGVGSSNWVHQNYDATTLKTTISDPTAALIKATKTYASPYTPDFIVFDKYEMDAIPSATGIGYLFNARDWTNVLNYVKNISEALGNMPVMLWQIPGGHLQQQSNDVDPRNNHASTEPDFFFGDSYNPLTNLRNYIANTTLPTGIYGTSSIINYLQMDPSGTTNLYNWQTNNLQQAANSHVFSILWGGGNTTSVSSFPSDDGGWLASKIINYYKNPINLSLK
ncbi:hypothetical protein ACNVED_02630 [Legionella sp. D16C41]|uniref:hypothetical protein n=1 Tax=Legionella sp. D16C41 TaxID=3402688 RepID=UPI003AF6F47B